MMDFVGLGVSVGVEESSAEEGARAERKWEMASWVVRIGCVRFMDRLAKVDWSTEEADPGGCQKLENC